MQLFDLLVQLATDTAQENMPMTQTVTQPSTSITLTDAAIAKAAQLIAAEEQEGLFLRVAVRPGGCSGMSYERNADV